MGRTKTKAYLENINDTAEIFKALGHPARLQILKILLSKKSCTCGTIVSQLPLAQSTVSKHLVELKKAKLVTFTNQGKKTIYTLIDENLMQTKDFLVHHINENKKDIIENVLKRKPVVKNSRNVRKSNPGLKNENYVFNHLNFKKGNNQSDQ